MVSVGDKCKKIHVVSARDRARVRKFELGDRICEKSDCTCARSACYVYPKNGLKKTPSLKPFMKGTNHIPERNEIPEIIDAINKRLDEFATTAKAPKVKLDNTIDLTPLFSRKIRGHYYYTRHNLFEDVSSVNQWVEESDRAVKIGYGFNPDAVELMMYILISAERWDEGGASVALKLANSDFKFESLFYGNVCQYENLGLRRVFTDLLMCYIYLNMMERTGEYGISNQRFAETFSNYDFACQLLDTDRISVEELAKWTRNPDNVKVLKRKVFEVMWRLHFIIKHARLSVGDYFKTHWLVCAFRFFFKIKIRFILKYKKS